MTMETNILTMQLFLQRSIWSQIGRQFDWPFSTVKQHLYYQLLGFCDASTLGYSYNQITVRLIIAQSKVQKLSIYRVSLLLLVRLSTASHTLKIFVTTLVSIILANISVSAKCHWSIHSSWYIISRCVSLSSIIFIRTAEKSARPGYT